IMPAFGMSIKVDGSRGGTVSVSASNLAGSHAIGRINAPVDGGVKFINPMTNDYDVAKGELCLLAGNPFETIVQYNSRVRSGIRLAEYRGPRRRPYESDQ